MASPDEFDIIFFPTWNFLRLELKLPAATFIVSGDFRPFLNGFTILGHRGHGYHKTVSDV